MQRKELSFKAVNREAAGRLQLSVRQIQRIKTKFGVLGWKGVVHGLKGKPSNRRKK